MNPFYQILIRDQDTKGETPPRYRDGLRQGSQSRLQAGRQGGLLIRVVLLEKRSVIVQTRWDYTWERWFAPSGGSLMLARAVWPLGWGRRLTADEEFSALRALLKGGRLTVCDPCGGLFPVGAQPCHCHY